MKTIGLIGGTSWLSTAEYYRIINQQVNKRLGGDHSAKMILYSVDFEELRPPTDWNGWLAMADVLAGISEKLIAAGADCILICSNTPHIVADVIQEKIKVPLINIAEETAKEIARRKFKTVALLGTKYTMEHSFFKEKLLKFGTTPLIPEKPARQMIHDSIYNEFGKGIFKEETKNDYLQVIEKLKKQGAEGVIFGCTEIPLLIRPDECPLPIFDTTYIHSTAAVNHALAI